jgi:sugar O-acyltransferase (sialic acid O-acetyltransferase NeuD family)
MALGHLRADSTLEVIAFSAERKYITKSGYSGLPVVPFEDLERHYSPSDCSLLVAVSFVGLNRTRTRLYREGKEKGFSFASYISSRSAVFKNAKIGENCVVHEGAILEIDSQVGNNVHIAGGAMISHESRVADNSYIGPRAVVAGESEIGENSILGVNCTVIDSVKIARDCVIGAGAVVLKDTEPGRIYVGNPAKPLAKTSYEKFGLNHHYVSGAPRIINRFVEL